MSQRDRDIKPQVEHDGTIATRYPWYCGGAQTCLPCASWCVNQDSCGGLIKAKHIFAARTTLDAVHWGARET